MVDSTVSEVRQELDSRPMGSFQMMAVAMCCALNMLDGFDVMVMPFAASSVADEWQLTPTFLGIMLTAALFGMAVGSLTIAPMGDRLGRRKLVLVCLALVTLGMMASSQAMHGEHLVLYRFLTGLGIGGMLATLNTLVSEFSNRSKRGLCISVLQSSFPLGAILGGLISVYLVSNFGWRALFLFGAVASACMMPLVYWKLPESLDFLLSHQSESALSEIKRLGGKMGLSEENFSGPHENAYQSNGLKAILVEPFKRSTYSIWTGFFCLMFAFYYVVSWTSKLLVDAGLSTAQGISANIYIMTGGIIGSVILGLLTQRYDVTKLTSTYLLLCVVAMAVFGLADLELVGLLISASFMGFFLIGAMIGLYTIAPDLYPSTHRATGMGWAIGVGRIGAIISPFFGGVLLDLGLVSDQVIIIFSLPLIVAAYTVKTIKF